MYGEMQESGCTEVIPFICSSAIGAGWPQLSGQGGVFPGGSDGKASACNAETWVSSPGREEPLEKEMAAHSSILAWRIPWTEEPGRLQPTGSQRIGQD